MTSAITASGLLRQPPQLEGNAWTGLGLQWLRVENTPTQGRERKNNRLRSSLRQAITLLHDTWRSVPLEDTILFEIGGARTDDFVRIDDKILIPTMRKNKIWKHMDDTTETPASDTATRKVTDTMDGISPTGTHKPELDKKKAITPWPYNSLVVLRDVAPTAGGLSDVWAKISATVATGRRVVLVLEDPPERYAKAKCTSNYFREREGVCFAWFPPGTIAFGHAVATQPRLRNHGTRATSNTRPAGHDRSTDYTKTTPCTEQKPAPIPHITGWLMPS